MGLQCRLFKADAFIQQAFPYFFSSSRRVYCYVYDFQAAASGIPISNQTADYNILLVSGQDTICAKQWIVRVFDSGNNILLERFSFIRIGECMDKYLFLKLQQEWFVFIQIASFYKCMGHFFLLCL